MPVDIRNFFAKKGAPAKPKSSSSSSGDKDKKSSQKRPSVKKTASRNNSTPLSPIAEDRPSMVAKKKKKQKRQMHLESDSEEETAVVKSKITTRKNVLDSGSDTEGEVEVVAPQKSAQKSIPKKPEKNQVTTSSYFASPSAYSPSKRSSARKSKPKRSYVLDDSDLDDDDEPEEDKYEDNNDGPDDDEVLEVDEEEEKKDSSRKRPSPAKAAKSPPSKPVRKPSPFKKQKVDPKKEVDDGNVVDMANDDTTDEEIKAKKTPAPKTKRLIKSPPPASDTPPSSKKRRTSSIKKKSPAVPKEPLIEPTLELDSFDVDEAVSECMAGATFVFTGVLDGVSRDDAIDMVKILGGRVTTAVSSKTSYLVVGPLLEDGRSYEEGKKYQKAVELGSVKIVMGEKRFYGLAKLYSDRAKAKQLAALGKENNMEAKPATAAAPAKKTVANPYAKKVTNPYAKKVSNPYAKPTSSSNPYAKSTSGATVESVHVDNKTFGPNDLWVDKYAPSSTRNILGNKDSVTKLTAWLGNWERKFINEKAIGKAFSSPNGPWKAALLSGPPGIGKTTTATLVAKEAGRDTLEYNASDVRSKKAMSESFGDIIGSQSVEGFFQKTDSNGKKVGKQPGKQKKLRCLIFDEVDGMSAGDRGGMAELIQMIKKSRVPIICICNDRQSQKMKSLLPYCMDLRFKRPIKSQIAKAAVKVAEREGLKVEQNAAEAMAESCGNDIRQVINALQMWASEKQCSTMTYKGLKEREKAINKDEILRVSLFDASKMILEGRRGLADADAEAQRSSFFKRNDAFFTDYGFTGLIVQQNYLKVMTSQGNEVKRKKDDDMMLDFLDRVHSAAHTMSDFAMVENKIRGGSDMNWGLLPFAGTLAVKTGFHASGPNGSFFPGFPEFTTWLGRNSSKGKKSRVLQELNHHMNYKISGGTSEVRLSYLPFLRQRFYAQLKTSQDEDRNAVAIELMDDYGLDRDDVFENLDEFNLSKKGGTLGDLLDSKQKAAFTREYNKGKHTSQALVSEQGNQKPTKRKGGDSAETADPDAIDDDKVDEDDDEEDDEAAMKKIRDAFAKKGRKAAAAKNAKAKGKGRKK